MMNRKLLLVLFLLLAAPLGVVAAEAKVEAIDFVWSAHRAFFDFVGKEDHQVIAYYDASRQMSVAHRESNKPWRFQKLRSYLGWDSHNAVVVGIDEAGHILSLIHISEPTRLLRRSRMPSSA